MRHKDACLQLLASCERGGASRVSRFPTRLPGSGPVSSPGSAPPSPAFLDTPEVFSSGSAGIMSETVFGLLFFGGSVGESGRAKVYFSLGRFF